jgi:hypothetical protein
MDNNRLKPITIVLQGQYNSKKIGPLLVPGNSDPLCQDLRLFSNPNYEKLVKMPGKS